MTQIEIIYSNNIIIGFSMKGHAGYNLCGPDILCASLSTASQMTINGILDWTGLSLDDIAFECNSALGILHIELPNESYSSIVVQQLFKSFEMHVESLEEGYSQFIKLERRQKND